MTRRVVVVPPDLALPEAWKLMTRCRFRHLPVVEEGVLLGILSDRDVLERSELVADGALEVPSIRVSCAMSPAPFVCAPDTEVIELVRAMTEGKIDAIPVVGSTGRLIGLVTSTDLLLLLIGLDEARGPLPFKFELDAPDEPVLD